MARFKLLDSFENLLERDVISADLEKKHSVRPKRTGSRQQYASRTYVPVTSIYSILCIFIFESLRFSSKIAPVDWFENLLERDVISADLEKKHSVLYTPTLAG